MLFKISSLTLLAALLALSLSVTPIVLASPSFAGPGNDNFANALDITGSSGSVEGNNDGATKESWEGSYDGNPGGASVWYRWVAPANGDVAFDTAGSNLDTLLAVYTWPNRRGALVEAGSNDDDVSSGVRTSRVVFNAVAGTEYFIVVDGYNENTGRVSLNWTMLGAAPSAVRVRAPAAGANDDRANAQDVTGSSGSVGGSNDGATKERWEGGHAGDVGGASVWYRWVAPANGDVAFDTSGSTFDTLLGVYMFTGPNRSGSFVEVRSNDDANSNVRTSYVKFDVKAGVEYLVAVDGYNGATGQLTLTWRLDQSASPTVDLAVTDLFPDNMPRGRVFTRITNDGPAILTNLGVKLVCDGEAAPSCSPGSRCAAVIYPLDRVERTVYITLRPGQTGIYDTGIWIDTSGANYRIACSVSGSFVDPRPSNNTYRENIP